MSFFYLSLFRFNVYFRRGIFEFRRFHVTESFGKRMRLCEKEKKTREIASYLYWACESEFPRRIWLQTSEDEGD